MSGVLGPEKQMLYFFHYLRYYCYFFVFVCRCFARAVGSYCFQDPRPISKHGRSDHVLNENSNTIGEVGEYCFQDPV